MAYRQAVLAAFLSGLVAITAPSAFASGVTAQAAVLHRASELIGDQIREAERGLYVAEVQDFLIDRESGRIAFVVLVAGGRFEPPSDALVLALPDPDFSMAEGTLGVAVTLRALRNLPRLDRTLGNADPAERQRLVSVKALLGASLKGASGEDIGSVTDAVVDIGNARLAYVTADFDPSWMATGKRVAIENPRIVDDGDGGVAVTADAGALRAAREWRETDDPRLVRLGLWGRIQRWLGFH